MNIYKLMPLTNVLDEQDMKKLKSELEDCGCIGIDINNYSSPDYSVLRFHRIGMLFLCCPDGSQPFFQFRDLLFCLFGFIQIFL